MSERAESHAIIVHAAGLSLCRTRAGGRRCNGVNLSEIVNRDDIPAAVAEGRNCAENREAFAGLLASQSHRCSIDTKGRRNGSSGRNVDARLRMLLY